MTVVEFNEKLREMTNGFVVVPINDRVGYAKGDVGGYESVISSEWANWHLNLRDAIICRKVTVELNDDLMEK